MENSFVLKYSDDDLLYLSGIQHIAFCERQWAMIHVEQQWSENILTIEGKQLHSKVDDPFEIERRPGIVLLRSVNLVSYTLGLTGKADVIELVKTEIELKDESISIQGKEGWWLFNPVEYKRGKPKPDERDEVQLCAQAICLEEMHGVKISKGALYYGETKHRTIVDFTDDLRLKVKNYAKRMHELFDNKITPKAVYAPHCKSCSLYNLCLPKIHGNYKSVNDYMDKQMY